MPVEKVPLNYRPAVKKTLPIREIEIPASHMEALDRSIRQKVRQAEVNRTSSTEAVKDHIVR